MNTSVAVVTKPQDFSPVSKLGPEILSSRWDSWLVGGLSLVFLIFFHFFVSPKNDIKTISWTMYYASFVVNWPHFMMSYQILYGDLRSHWPEKKRYLWSGLVVPLLLIVAFAFSYLLPSPVGMGLLVQFMFVSVGWHYVKQVYGMMVVPAAKVGFYFDRPLRVAALSNLYSLWALSFVNGNYQERQAEFYGVKYFIPGLPTWLLTLCYVFVGATGLIFLFLLLRRWWERGQWLPTISWMSFLSLYAWYLPITYHPHFFYMVPFFHSLQYILFVAALKRNQGLAQHSLETPEGRRALAKSWIGFFGLSFLTGMMFFSWLPKWLDTQVLDAARAEVLGPSVFLAMFHLFINIHHYFIDHVIWRKDTPGLIL